MKTWFLCGAIALALPTVVPAAATTSASLASASAETAAERDARMAWWREARFGLFIHWGIYSVPAGVHEGKEIYGTRRLLNGAEWVMNYGKIPVQEYAKFARQFDPVKFDATAWATAAKGAGMKYVIVTAKHHDGFAMFHSRVSPFNIVDAAPFKRDVIRELAEACRAQGLKFGVYYSQAQDWHHPGGSAEGGHWDPVQDGSMDEYIDRVAVPQVRELLSNYGEISVLWWDTPHGITPARAEKFLPLLRIQPKLITNNRLGGGYRGDTQTPEQRIPPDGVPGRDWETCMTMNDTWGYRASDHNWKSPERLIRNLVDIASKGGNYLLNVGPTADGVIPEPSLQRLKAIGDWMTVNREAVHGTTASPFKTQFPWGRCTKRVSHDGTDGTLYLHVFNWPAERKLLLPGLRTEIESARLLAGGAKLETTADDTGTLVHLPTSAPDPISSTIVLKMKGPIVVKTEAER